MKVRRLDCYSLSLPLRDGGYMMSHGRFLAALETTVVRLESEDGSIGYGEACTLGANYIEGFGGSVVATIRELAPVVVGCPISQADVLVRRMDAHIRGHLAGKSAVDIAMWDLRGKSLGTPVADLLGGVHQPDYSVFYPIGIGSPEEMAEEAERELSRGYRSWQLKAGDDPLVDSARLQAVLEAIGDQRDFVTCDANRGWTIAQARTFLRETEGFGVFVEQPCPSLAEMAQARAGFGTSLIADESICDIRDLFSCVALNAAEAVNLKPTRVGGLTAASKLRDAIQSLGLMLMIDEPMGGEIATAAVSHLAASCMPEHFLAASHLAEFSTLRIERSGALRVTDGRAGAPMGPGLGLDIDESSFGSPLFSFTAEEDLHG